VNTLEKTFDPMIKIKVRTSISSANKLEDIRTIILKIPADKLYEIEEAIMGAYSKLAKYEVPKIRVENDR
jgi:hypothetical protein